MKLVFKLKDGTTITQTINESLIFNEAMFNMLMQQAKQTYGINPINNNPKTKGMKMSDLRAVEILFS